MCEHGAAATSPSGTSPNPEKSKSCITSLEGQTEKLETMWVAKEDGKNHGKKSASISSLQETTKEPSSVMEVARLTPGKAAAEAGKVAGLTPGKAAAAAGCPPDCPLGRVAAENPAGRSPLKTQWAGRPFLCIDLGRGIAPGLLLVGINLRGGCLSSSHAAPRRAHPT